MPVKIESPYGRSPEVLARDSEVPARAKIEPWRAEHDLRRDLDLEADESGLASQVSEFEERRRQRLLSETDELPSLLREQRALAGGSSILWLLALIVLVGDLVAVLPLVARFLGTDAISMWTDGRVIVAQISLLAISTTALLTLVAHWLLGRLQRPPPSAPGSHDNHGALLLNELQAALPTYAALATYLVFVVALAAVRVQLDSQGNSLTDVAPGADPALATTVMSVLVAFAPMGAAALIEAARKQSGRRRELAARLAELHGRRDGLDELLAEARARLEEVRQERQTIRARFDRSFAASTRPRPRSSEDRASPRTLAPRLSQLPGLGTLLAQGVVALLLLMMVLWMASCAPAPSGAALAVVVDASDGNLDEERRPVESAALASAWRAFVDQTRLPAETSIWMTTVSDGIETETVYQASAPRRWPSGAGALDARRAFAETVERDLAELQIKPLKKSAVLAAIWSAARRLQESDATERWLVVLSDGRDLRVSGPDRSGWWFAREVPEPDDVLTELRRTHELPDLRGVHLTICGVHARSVLSRAWTPAQDVRLRSVFRSLGEEAGASSVRVLEHCSPSSFSPNNKTRSAS